MTSRKWDAKPRIATTATERVVGIPELLDNIFGYNRTADNARCARVSRAWSDLALDHVWRIDPPVRILFQLLAPLVPQNRRSRTYNNGLVFSRAVRPDDWQRFNGYAKRVKELDIDIDSMPGLYSSRDGIDDSVYKEISATRTVVPILPNLQKLKCFDNISTSRLRCIRLLLHESITSLLFNLRDSLSSTRTMENARLLFEGLLLYTPNVTWLDFSIVHDAESTEKDVCFLLNGLKHLKTLYLHPYNLTTAVLHPIARLPNLKHIDMAFCQYPVKMEVDMQLPDFDNAFKSPERFGLKTYLKTITSLFSYKAFSSRIRTLEIILATYHLASDLRQCLEFLASSCPGLTKLKLCTPDDVCTSLSSKTVVARDLAPLMSFLLLEEFELQSEADFSVSDVELVDIIKECPSIRRLTLNSALFPVRSTSLTLKLLALLASEPVGAKLEHLEIYLDASADFKLPVVEGSLKSLHTISFGISPVSASNDEIPLFLSQLIPATCQFNVYSALRGRTSLERQAAWREIRRSLALFAEID